MNIYGLQKMTLLDFPGRVACTVFLGGCNLRCPYCHNYELVTMSVPPVMSDEDLSAFLEKRRGLLDGVAVTGGEPCLRKDLPAFLQRIKDLGYPVKLDTNGAHPAMLRTLINGGLVDYIAMDVKNSRAKYARTVGLSEIDLAPIDESIRLIRDSGIPYEFRTTVVHGLHVAEDFEDIGRWIEGAERYYLQAFTDRDAVPDRNLTAPTPDELRHFHEIAAKFVQLSEVRGVDE